MTRALAALPIMAFLSAFAMQAAGCEAVPSLTFEDGDGGVPGDGAARSDALLSDAGCGAPLCCGMTPCYGALCSESGCQTVCAPKCGPNDVCCTKATGGVIGLTCVSSTTYLSSGCH